MIHYHGVPITPQEAAVAALSGGHAFVSARHPGQLGIVVDICQSFAVDNGAYPAWRAGEPITDWGFYYEWAADCLRYPNCDFAVIPDSIDGTEQDNDALIDAWPFERWKGAPVWHMHESLSKLARLVLTWPRVCLGSSGAYSVVGSPAWWARMHEAMMVACDAEGRPVTKLHGLRMLNQRVFRALPLASADSTNIGRNVNIDSNWKNGTYLPYGKPARASVMRNRIEAHNSPATWSASAAAAL